MANDFERMTSSSWTHAAQGEERRQRRDQREADELAGVAFRIRRVRRRGEPQRGEHRGDQDVAEAEVGHEVAHASSHGSRALPGV